MTDERNPIVILLADDDKDDQLLTKDALDESRVANQLIIVDDGVELMEYLRGEGKYAEQDNPWPGLILLDLNMPRKDGREALAEIKADPVLRRIPVVILTTSKVEEDMLNGYELGAASYLTKPVTFDGLVKLMKAVGTYWVEFVELPRGSNNSVK
ncbi:MAG: response regulator [Pseudomonadota bacterium]|nr:two-component system response regulator [Pseudomonadales bacterium]MDY6919239.1 response regulator [Pseudomonadota bacterium]